MQRVSLSLSNLEFLDILRYKKAASELILCSICQALIYKYHQQQEDVLDHIQQVFPHSSYAPG